VNPLLVEDGDDDDGNDDGNDDDGNGGTAGCDGRTASKTEAVQKIHGMRDEMEGIKGQMSGLQTELVELSQKHQVCF